jgi:hypothetical protein
MVSVFGWPGFSMYKYHILLFYLKEERRRCKRLQCLLDEQRQKKKVSNGYIVTRKNLTTCQQVSEIFI